MKLKIVSYLEPRHHTSCAVFDPVRDRCDCGAEPIPLVRLDHALKIINEGIK